VERSVLREVAAAVHRCNLLFLVKGPLCTAVRSGGFSAFHVGEGAEQRRAVFEVRGEYEVRGGGSDVFAIFDLHSSERWSGRP